MGLVITSQFRRPIPPCLFVSMGNVVFAKLDFAKVETDNAKMSSQRFCCSKKWTLWVAKILTDLCGTLKNRSNWTKSWVCQSTKLVFCFGCFIPLARVRAARHCTSGWHAAYAEFRVFCFLLTPPPALGVAAKRKVAWCSLFAQIALFCFRTTFSILRTRFLILKETHKDELIKDVQTICSRR